MFYIKLEWEVVSLAYFATKKVPEMAVGDRSQM